MIHNVSLYLIQDDVHDLGRFVYRDRSDHYYHGHQSPSHPGPMHHWILGMFGLFTAQLGSLAARGLEMYHDYKKIEGGDFSDLDSDILKMVEESNTVPLDEYKNEVMAIAPVSVQSKAKVDKSPLKPPEVTDLPLF